MIDPNRMRPLGRILTAPGGRSPSLAGRLVGLCALLLAAASSGLAALPHDEAAQGGLRTLQCTNPASGARWKVRIDFPAATAHSFPAKVTAGIITWHDRVDGGSYRLDRSTGALTVIYPSSTGGFMLRYDCRRLP